MRFRILEFYKRHHYFAKEALLKDINTVFIYRKQLKKVRVVLIAGVVIRYQAVNLTNLQMNEVDFVCDLADFTWVVNSG